MHGTRKVKIEMLLDYSEREDLIQEQTYVKKLG